MFFKRRNKSFLHFEMYLLVSLQINRMIYFYAYTNIPLKTIRLPKYNVAIKLSVQLTFLRIIILYYRFKSLIASIIDVTVICSVTQDVSKTPLDAYHYAPSAYPAMRKTKKCETKKSI